MTLKGTCDHITGYWGQDSSKRGEITGGFFDSYSRTLSFSYKQSWNSVTNGRAVLTLSADGKTLDGRYRGDGGNGI
ncbi:MAG: hypothetical protein LC776_12975 [Acidobacteria bacterium]|nr:hypothetical protein [Acidobacteriota bacterium]